MANLPVHRTSPAELVSGPLLAALVALTCGPASAPRSAPALHPGPATAPAPAAAPSRERLEPSTAAPSRERLETSAPGGTRDPSEIAGWSSLYAEQARLMLGEDAEPGELPSSDVEARERLCTDETGAPLCDGPLPWAVSIAADGRWAWLVVGEEGGRLIHSELVGRGGLGRCGAATSAELERSAAGLTLVVEDYIEFADLECDCAEDFEGEPDPENCDCYDACGTPVTARCRIRVDPRSLELSAPEGECSARAAGARQGLVD